MEKVYEELDEIKAENEKLRADCQRKSELFESLKKANNEQHIKIKEFGLKFEKQSQELLQKEEEVSGLRQSYEDLKCSFNEKETIIKRLNAANEKLRADWDEKYRNWEEEKRGLLLALDEANEKNIDEEQKINVLRAEIEGLKELLSVSQKKCTEAEKKAKNPKELRQRDDMLLNLEEENRKVEDKLKWKMEQFKHLEEAHGKLRDQFRVSQKEWEQEKSTLYDEISSLQMNLDSQISISKDLQHRLQLCNQALAHEETRRKYLEVEVSDFRKRFENAFAECQDSKSQLELISAQRDNEIASLRHSLCTKETFYKDLEYRTAKLEQENEELLISLKEAQEARIQEAGSSSSLSKLRNKLKNVEQMHRDCSKILRAKEAEWNSQLEKVTKELNESKSQLETKDAELEELKIEFEACLSSAMQLKLQNEELSLMLLVLKSGIYEAQLKLADIEGELSLHKKERGEKVSLLMQQLDMKNTALAKAQRDIEEENAKTLILLKRVESLELIEDQHNLMQKEILRSKEMLEESYKCQLLLKQKALQVESDSKEELRKACDALDVANSELTEEREKVASLLRRVQSLELLEEQRLLMQKQLEEQKKLIEEAATNQLCLEEQASQIESQSKEKLREVCHALEMAKSELAKEREKAHILMGMVESLELIEEQLTMMQKELERYKEMYKESSRRQSHLEEQILQMEVDSEERLREVCDALDEANSALFEKTSEGHEIEFELWIWKSVAEQLKVCLEDNQMLRKELEASLLAEVEDGENIKQEKDCLAHVLEEKDSRISNLQQQVLLLEQELKTREVEAVSSSRMETASSLESERDSFLQITCEKNKILEDLQKEIDMLEQESLRRELEAAAFAYMGAERTLEHEKENLAQNMKEKDQRIDGLMQAVKSMEENFNLSLNSFSSQLAEKQTEMNLVCEAWENIAKAEILAQLEIEEKKLMISELEDDIRDMQEKLILQERSLSGTKQQAMKVEAELQAKQMEMKSLTNEMEAKLRTSDALIDELMCEKRNLLEDVMKLSMERENLFDFIGGLGDRIISKLSSEDMQLMGMLGRIVQSCDASGMALKGNDEAFNSVKENIHNISSPTTKRLESIVEERSPFRQLN
ncbi:hypothetical protein SLA2020_082420 [Shorea laevis]